MPALQTKRSPEIKGLYANANRFTQPDGTVPRLSNVYMVRRGALHTVPGSKWVSSYDGLAPHSTAQQAIVDIDWYSPSLGSGPQAYLASTGAATIGAAGNDYVLILQNTSTPGVALLNASGSTFVQLAVQNGLVSPLTNAQQFGDYLLVAFGNNVAPNIFPTVTQTTGALTSSQTTIPVLSTLAFPKSGLIKIDSEVIQYTGITQGSFTGCVRGVASTVAATHNSGTNVFYYTYSSASAVNTTLTVNLTSSAVSAQVAATAAFQPPRVITPPLILIDDEYMSYTTGDTTHFSSLTRGAWGTVAAAHSNGALVFQPATQYSGLPNSTTLTASITSGATGSLAVAQTLQFPPTGVVVVDTEAILYTGKTATSLTGLTRAVSGTTAASHSNGAMVTQVTGSVMSAGSQVWAPIVNVFDPSLVYGPYPGIIGSTGLSSQSVNIGTLIFIIDGQGTAWLFRAQNSGVTGFGSTYRGPQFFPNGSWSGGLDGGASSDGSMSSGSNILTSNQSPFTAAMVGLPIMVVGCGSNAGPLLTTVAGFTDANHITLAINAGTSQNGTGYAIGTGNFGDTAKDFNPATTGAGKQTGTVVWKNVGQAAPNPVGTAYIFDHLNNVYLWGVGNTYGSDGISGPDALWQSDNGQPLSYNPANTTFVGKGDGTSAQGGAVYSLSEAGIAATPQIVLFKDASTYSFLNSFPNASLVEVSGGLGCIAPGTIQFIGGYGVMRLSYAGVTLFDGQLEHVTEYTDAIRGYLFGGLSDVTAVDFSKIQDCVATQSVNPPMYVFFAPLVGGSGHVTRGFGYDFGLKQWFVMDIPFPITAAEFLPQAVAALTQGYQSLIAGLNDGALRRVFAGDVDFDGAAIAWKAQLPDISYGTTPVYARRANAFITADGGGSGQALTQISFTGTRRSGQTFTRNLNLPASLISTMDIGEVILSGQLTVAGQGQVLIEGSAIQSSEKPMSRVGI